MSFETDFSELFERDNLDTNKIIDMMFKDNNIEMKTHIKDPFTMSVLKSTIDNIENILKRPDYKKEDFDNQEFKLPTFKNILSTFETKLLVMLVSWDRLGRTECFDTLRSQRDEGTGARSFFQKMLGTGR